MIAKYEIEYCLNSNHNDRVDTHRTNDPVEAEDFLVTLLSTGTMILEIKHEGVSLASLHRDRMIQIAAERLVSTLLRTSLKLDAPTVKHRFGFPA